ncbi:MAG: class I SAM-dependent methyltransferase family protein [Sedimentisphaerales bacterium]
MNGKRSGKQTGFVASFIARLGRPVIRHLSDLAHESLKDPGSWRCLEIVYRNEPRTLLDRFFLSCSSARGVRNRLRVLQEEICKCIVERARINNPVRLINFGAGLGHEILGSIERLRGSVVVKATCIDKEPDAIEQGRLLAAQKGLNVNYIQGNVLRMNLIPNKYDIGVMSGLIDYFDFETAVSVLKMVKEQLMQGGTIFIANMRRHKLASTMSILGNWNLVYREPEDVESLLAESGYKDIEVWLEPEKVFCIGKAKTLE